MESLIYPLISSRACLLCLIGQPIHRGPLFHTLLLLKRSHASPIQTNSPYILHVLKGTSIYLLIQGTSSQPLCRRRSCSYLEGEEHLFHREMDLCPYPPFNLYIEGGLVLTPRGKSISFIEKWIFVRTQLSQ